MANYQGMTHYPQEPFPPAAAAVTSYFGDVLRGKPPDLPGGIYDIRRSLESDDYGTAAEAFMPGSGFAKVGAGLLGMTKNVDALRALSFMDKYDIPLVNPATGEAFTRETKDLSDLAQLRNYGKALRNRGFRARERMRSEGGHETIISGDPIDYAAKEFDVADLEGKVLVPLMSDRTPRGSLVEQVGGIALPSPVRMEGGAGFAADPENIALGHAYASTAGAAQGIQNRLTKAAEATGRDPVWVWGAMGPEAFDFAHFPMDIVGQQMAILRDEIPKKTLRAFDADVRQLATPRARGDAPYPRANEWLGWEDPQALDQLMGRGEFSVEGAGAMRKAVLDRMKMPGWQQQGFPHYGDLLTAVTEPRLAGANIGDTGAVFLAGEPGAELAVSTHGSYPAALRGSYLGGSETLYPGEMMWRDILHGHEYLPRLHRAISTNESYQVATPELVDALVNYRRAQTEPGP